MIDCVKFGILCDYKANDEKIKKYLHEIALCHVNRTVRTVNSLSSDDFGHIAQQQRFNNIKMRTA